MARTKNIKRPEVRQGQPAPHVPAQAQTAPPPPPQAPQAGPTLPEGPPRGRNEEGPWGDASFWEEGLQGVGDLGWAAGRLDSEEKRRSWEAPAQ